MAQIKLAEYTFDNSVGDVMPSLTPNTITMTKEDSVSGTTTRRIVFIDNATMPTRLHFENKANLLTVEYIDDTNISNYTYMFSGCTNLTSVNTDNWNTSNAKSFTYMFYGCNKITRISGIQNWSVSSITDFRFMFQNCSSLTKLNLRNWSTDSATTFQGMFHSCFSLTEIKGIENFNVTSSTSFGAMFYSCLSLTELDLRNWVTSSATTFQSMFDNCTNLEVIRVDNFDTSKATGTGLNGMFSYCKKVKTLNLNSFVNAGLGSFINFCYNCESLEYISAQNFVWGNCNAIQGAFKNCKKLKMLDLTNFDGTTIGTTGVSLRLTGSFDGVTCPIYYNSNMCTANDTELTSLSNAVDIQGRLMAVYDFNNSVTTSDSAYPTLTGSTVTKTIDTQGSESYITHRVIGVDVMPTTISFKPIGGLLNVDYLAVTSSCTSLASLFENCFRMTYVDTFGWDTSNVTSFGYCFRNCSSLTEIRNIQDLKVTSKATAAYDFFLDCSKLTSLDLTHWDVSGIRNGSVMFSGCSGLTSLNISNWDVSSMQYGNSMFQGCTSLSELDLTSFKTTAMEGDNHNMFNGWTSDQIVYIHDTNWTIDVSSYNATFVRRLSILLARYTFNNSVSDCLPKFNDNTIPSSPNYKISDMINDTVTTRLISVDDEALLPTRIHFSDDGYSAGRSIITCDYLNTSNCTSLYLLFYACGSYLTSVNMTGWDTSKVTNLHYAFYRNNQLTEIIGIEDIDTSSLVDARGIFNITPKLTTLDLSKWDVSKVQVLSRAFSGCGATTINISTWNTCSATTMESMFEGCALTELDITHFDTSNVTILSDMFSNVRISSIDLSGWDVRKVQQTRLMFNSGSITEIKLDGWNTESLTDMWAMFCGSGITTVDINHFNVSKVTNVSQLFDQCKNLVSVDMSNLHFTSCQNISSMFSRCNNLTTVEMADFTGSPLNNILSFCHNANKLTEIDVSTFDTSRVTNLQNIFSECYELERIIGIEKWDTSNVTGAYYAFNNCYKISELDLSGWDTRKFSSKDDASMFYSWGSQQEQTVYYEPPYWDLNHKSFNNTANFVIKITRNNGYWLDMTGITEDTTITLYNENNLPTEEILTDWGDGTQNSELTHTYSTAGEYVVVSNLQIGATLQKIGTYTIKAVIYYYTNPSNLFFGFNKMTEAVLTDHYVELVNEKKPTNFDRMLYSTKLQKLPDNLNKIDTSSATSMNQMFYGFQSLTEQDIDLTWMNVSNVTSMSGMFEWSTTIKSLNTTGWNTSKVQNMSSMFHGAKGLTNLDLSHWDMSSCTNMSGMFNEAIALTSLDVSSWNFEKCTAINQFIRETTNLVDFNMSGVTFGATSVNFQNFAHQSGVQNVNMSNITTADRVSFESPFYGCGKLKTIDFSNSHFKPSNMQNMFKGCSSLTSLDLSLWDVSQCTTMQDMFNGCGINVINLANWNTSKVTLFGGMFSNCSNLTHADLSGFTAENCTGCANMFFRCTNLKTVDLSSFKPLPSKKVNSEGMFASCSSLEKIDLSNFDTESMSKFNNLLNLGSRNITLGLLYASASTINDVISTWGSVENGIVYYYDADSSQLTPVEGVTFKKYQVPTTIQLPPHIQLHSLPDGTRDEVDIKTGILTRNVGCIVLNGTEEWNIDTLEGDFVYTQTKYEIPNSKTEYLPWNETDVQQIISSFMPYDYYAMHNRSKESLGIVGNKARIVIKQSRLNGLSVAEWIKANPILLLYGVKQATTEQLILNYNNSCDYGRILPTGMCDKYSVVDSMYTQTMTSILLDGENTWDAMEEFENTVKFTATGTTVGVENLNMLGAGGLYCDNDLFPNINDDSDVPHCRVDEAGNKFYIYVDKEMLMSPDLIGWQIWLQANNFNLIYELAEHLTYVKPYEELDATQARWEGMDCMRDGAIKYHTNSSDNITMYPTLEYVAPSINNFEVTMLEPNTDYTIYAEGINTNDTINLGGNDINFNNGTVYTSGDNQWLRIDNNDSFYNMVITKGDTTGEVVPYFEGMTSVENPKVESPNPINLMPLTETIAMNQKVILEKPIAVKKDEIYTFIAKGTIEYTDPSIKDYSTFAFLENSTDSTLTLSLLNMTIGKYTLTGERNTITLKATRDGVINYYCWYNSGYVATATIEEIMLAKGENVEYTPYGGSVVSYTDLKLRSLPNGVKDTINVVTGEYVQRVGEVTFNGNEDWVRSAHTNSMMFYTSLNNLAHKEDYLNSISCDKFVVYADEGTLHDSISLNGISGYVDWVDTYPNENWLYIKHADAESYTEKFKQWLKENPVTVQYELVEPIITKLDPQTLLAYTDGTINLSSDTGLLPTTHYTVPSTNTFHLPSMKTGTRYTLKYPSASGSITIGDINYSISSDSMLFTTPLKINGDTSAIIFSDTNPENVVLLEGAYNKREVPFFTGVKSVKNPNITIIDQLSTESTTYNCETEIELRGLPNGVADKLDIIKGKLTTNVGIRPYQEGDENLSNIWTDGYETVYALSSPVVTNVTIDHPTVTTNSLIELSSDYLIPQLNYRAPSSNNFPLDLLQSNATYTLYADTLVSGSYTLGGTKTGIYSQPHTITLGDMTDNLLTFNGDLGLSNVMLVKGNSLKTTLPPYFLGIRSVTDGHLLVEGMAGEMNEITFDEGIVLRDCNGVKDTIDLITSTLTKRTGEITLTGAEGWYRADNESTTDHNVFKLTLGGLKEALVMCDTLQSVFDTKMMDCIHAHTNELCIVIANATIGGDTVNALKSWLNQHPTTVVYQLSTPIEVQLENTWTTTPPTSYDNQTEISSTVSTNSLKPMISVTIATTTLEEIVSDLEAQNAELEAENTATMLALTSVYETLAAPAAVSTMSLDDEVSTVNLSDGKDGNSVNGMSVSPIGMVYVNLIRKGLKTIEQVPYNLQAEVRYALKGLE